MDVTFIYKGTKITTPNLEKKLKRMKLTMDDITIVKDIPKEISKDEDEKEIIIYHFSNGKESIYSVHNICPEGYTYIDKKVYKI